METRSNHRSITDTDPLMIGTESMLRFCRFCLSKSSNMNRLDWAQWEDSEMSRLFEQITGDSLPILEGISELWCEKCLQRMRESATLIEQLKKSRCFWLDSLKRIKGLGDIPPQVDEPYHGGNERSFVIVDNNESAAITNHYVQVKIASDPGVRVHQEPIKGTDTNRPKSNEAKKVAGPRQLCPICHGAYLDISRHLKLSHRDADLLECDMCSKRFASKTAIRKHFDEGHRFSCKICNKPNLTKPYCERHRDTQRRSLDNLIGCDQCDKSFHGRTRLAVHQKRVHLHSEVQCIVCGKIFQNIVRLKGHMIRHREKSITCAEPECPAMFWLTKDMKEHCRTVHRKERKFVCELCGRGFLMNAQLKVHKGFCRQGGGGGDGRSVIKKGALHREELECRICRKHCLVVKTLKFHYDKEHPAANWAEVLSKICQVCNRQFDSVREYDEHLQTTHNRWQCDICNRFLQCADSLERHRQTHSSIDNPFQCDICWTTFISRTKLNAHVRRHHAEKRHSCRICHMTFVENYELNNHQQRAHGIGERVLYACTECDRSFAKQCTLNTHTALKHTGTFMWFACRHCDQKFANPRNLSRHHAVYHQAEHGPI